MPGILFSQMEPPPGFEAEFHDWYETEHIPARLALPGIERARRYEALEGEPRFLAVYEISDLSVFATPAFRALRSSPSERTRAMLGRVNGFTRYVCEQISETGRNKDGEFLSVNAFLVPPPAVAAFGDWYELEHIPRLMAAPDWLRVGRYHVVDADDHTWTHFALHELASRQVIDSPERRQARTGPRRDVLAREEWFRRSGRWLYRMIFDTHPGAAGNSSKAPSD